MHNKARFPHAMYGVGTRTENAVLAIMILLLFLIFLFLFMTLTAEPVQGQTCHVLHNSSAAVQAWSHYGVGQAF